MPAIPAVEAGAGAPPPGRSGPPGRGPRRGAWIGGLALAALVGAAAWTIVADRLTPPRPASRGRLVRLLTMERPFPADGRDPGDPFVGPVACRACHPGECALHARSGHARTLSTAARRPLARQVDGISVRDPEHPEVSWEYRFADDRLHVGRRTRSNVEDLVAEYAFGSGHHAVTFVNMIDAETPAIFEHRMTYYAKTGTFGLTPGHDAVPRPPTLTPLGGLPPPADAWSCFACHSTQVSTVKGLRIDEDRLIPNVSCERCHGPGRAHVEAAAKGAPASELGLPFGRERGYTADQVIALCGMCHRHPGKAGVGPLDPENTHLARFQPVGILQSRCYRESGGGFRCVTCHDPPSRASPDRPAYNATCRTCHGGSPSEKTTALSHPDGPHDAAVRGLPCPREPSGDCVACHMPRVDAGQGVLFADHWIRVKRPTGR
jgi:hypothetical protein